MTSESTHLSTPSESAHASALVSALMGRAPKLALAFAAGQFVWPTAKVLRAKARERSTFTVKVPATDEIYDDLHEWVLGLLPSAQQHALVAWTAKRDHSVLVSIGGEPQKDTRLRLRYDGTREQSISIGGHKIKVVVLASSAKEQDFTPPEIMFTAYSLAAQQALIEEIAQVVRRGQESSRKPVFRMLSRWGSWERYDDLITRDLDSVILPGAQLQRLVADVQRFLGAEQQYLRRCVPWHRGHLYEGPPGTGKTSVARAIASHFGMDIWYLPLADVKKDCELLSVLNQIGPRSMLLLEDVDVFHAVTQRNDDSGVTLSGLLNALDGIATPHGLFTVLTTNTPEVLDPAVVRAGRIDLTEHFGLADDDQVQRLLSRWYGRPLEGTAGITGLSPADIIEVCKRHEDPASALRQLARTCPLVSGRS